MEVPAKLAELAGTCLTVSQDVADGWSAALVGLQVPSGAAGNTSGGSQLLAASVAAGDAAASAVGRLVAVLEADVEAVYLCAFDFSTTDEATAAALESSYTPNSGPQPTPGPGEFPESDPGPHEPSVPSPSPGPSPTPQVA